MRERTIHSHGQKLVLEGTLPEIGSKAPAFALLDKEGRTIRLSDLAGKIKLISVTPSIDTPVCDVQARRFNEEASRLPGDVVILNVSMDLPFALARYCAAAGIERVMTLSDHRTARFGTDYGLLIRERRLLARSVLIVDKNDRIQYAEVVQDLSEHPDYEKVLQALRTIVEQPKAA